MRPPRVPTPFEERVYAIVRRIPRGQVRSYQWVARRLGHANLARAVGNALNRNPWPFSATQPLGHLATRSMRVPCHRVIRSDGTLGGYASGVVRKRLLLRREGVRYT
jgi:methylated-DNA-[protein]-cysteine S-methyltransferase